MRSALAHELGADQVFLLLVLLRELLVDVRLRSPARCMPGSSSVSILHAELGEDVGPQAGPDRRCRDARLPGSACR